MSLHLKKLIAAFIEVLCGVFILCAAFFYLLLVLSPDISSEEFIWGMCLLPLLFICTLNIMFGPLLFRESLKAKGDLEHLLILKPRWKTQATRWVSLGKVIRVGRPKQAAPESGTTLDRLVAIKKQGHWLPDDQ